MVPLLDNTKNYMSKTERVPVIHLSQSQLSNVSTLVSFS